MTRPGIHIVDDDPDIRDGLAWLFESRGYAPLTWAGGQAFLDAMAQRVGDWGQAVVLLDVRMAPISGLVTFERLKALACPWPVLFLTGNADVGMAVAAVKNGAWDFMEKPFHDNELVDRVAQATAELANQQTMDAELQRMTLALQSLSPREREVLDELIQGHYNKTIADHLGITPRTVEFHRANLFEKMGVSSAIELAHKLGRLERKP